MSDDLLKRLRVMADRMPVANSQMCSDAADRIEELEAKLAKAVETISLCRKMQAQFAHTEDPLMVLLDTTIAELKEPSVKQSLTVQPTHQERTDQ